MELYIEILFGLLFCSAIKKQKLIFWIIIILGVLFYGFRAENIGTDTLMYTERYLAMFQGVETEHFEPLFSLLLYYLAKFKAPIWVMQISCGILLLFPLTVVIYRSKVNPIFALFFFYATFDYIVAFNIARQMIAVSFVMLAYSYYPNKIKTIIYILIGCGFHSSAVMAFVIFIFPYLNMRSIYVYMLMIGTLIGGMIMSNALAANFLGKYSIYVEALSKQNGFREDSTFSLMILALVWDALFLLINISATNELKKSKWFKLFFFMVLLNNLTFKSVLGKRIIHYFSCSQMILFPLLFKRNNNKEKNPIILYAMILFYVIVYFFKLIIQNADWYIPYKTIKHLPFFS